MGRNQELKEERGGYDCFGGGGVSGESTKPYRVILSTRNNI